MIGLDTNILVRYLTQDDPEQSAQANRLIETRCTPDFSDYVILFANKGAGCERLYSFDRKLIKHDFVCAP